ncbi:uncharacterized protein KGF55_005173 [Candida pseudojiufengensis]|uniref:uncharacterized protein n=1 Tax=Candida pseudojiufengensis TaxID=497109 RepID=UPI0022255D36|nr:uncharacterized protein KGF55_005173 [Candida pseudojiufengensis]KAI5959941.1 hypothetical protein KGF55_005173 [Candida pseudojiufengensis]
MSKSDDVLEFLESLPDSKTNPSKTSSSTKPSTSTNTTKNDKEVFDFLDEIAEHEQKKPKKKFEPKKKSDDSDSTITTKSENTKEQVEVEDDDEENDPTTGTSSSDTTDDQAQQHSPREKEDSLENPIASLSSWWSKEGNQKVSNLWGTITSNAEKISEQTYQLASNTTNQINEKSKNLDTDQISNKLNNIFLNISSQLKQGLIDDADEILNLLIVSDLYNINYLNDLILNNFKLTMNQVEGNININVNELNHHHNNLQEESNLINLNMFYGKLIDGEKLAFANLENSIKEYKKIEINKEKENNNQQQQQDIVKSNIFITIQPITTKNESTTTQEENQPDQNQQQTIIESNNNSSFSFTLILKDITNDITILTRTQPFPIRWSNWLENNNSHLNLQNEDFEEENVDPKNWVKDWIKQGLNLGFGILAQEYVIKRMGV